MKVTLESERNSISLKMHLISYGENTYSADGSMMTDLTITIPSSPTRAKELKKFINDSHSQEIVDESHKANYQHNTN